MMISLVYTLLAILGLSFLIFIHELGHYFMARRVGMRVETFSIGFGKPLFQWMHDGVKWQIGWLLFGGYVKIAGTDLEKDKNPYAVEDGFFGKTPLDRIKVAVMGPLTNIVFALLSFAMLWAIGGREKNFSDFTKKIGWVDPKSELYACGIRPGDEVTSYSDYQFQGAKDHIYAPMMGDEDTVVKGFKVNYATNEKVPFECPVKLYQHPSSLEKGILTAGILNSANYIIYQRLPNGKENPLPEGSPLKDSGIEYGDRIVWANGEIIFSTSGLNHVLDGNKVLLTVERDGKTFLSLTPRIQAQELRMDMRFKEELTDWQFAASLNSVKLQRLYMIPYNITNSCVVENGVKFIDKEKESEIFPKQSHSSLEAPLQQGDKIVAINGRPVNQAYELLRELQNYKINVIVQRDSHLKRAVSWDKEDEDFDHQFKPEDLQAIVNSLGTENPVKHKGNLYLLPAITPKRQSDLLLSTESKVHYAHEFKEQKKAIDSIEDPEKRAQALKYLEKQQQRLLLGLPGIQDKKVEYNPEPFSLFQNVFQEIWRTLSALVSGALNPKWIVGPIGIVQVVHDTSMGSLKEALYWLGAISLNLGILNLLPIPVLDGGTIFMSLIEIITKKRIHPKTLEKIIFPFAIILIGFFIFLTYNDILRLFR